MWLCQGIQALRTWLLPAEAEAGGAAKQSAMGTQHPPFTTPSQLALYLSTLSSSSLKSAFGWELLSSSGTI